MFRLRRGCGGGGAGGEGGWRLSWLIRSIRRPVAQIADMAPSRLTPICPTTSRRRRPPSFRWCRCPLGGISLGRGPPSIQLAYVMAAVGPDRGAEGRCGLSPGCGRIPFGAMRPGAGMHFAVKACVCRSALTRRCLYHRCHPAAGASLAVGRSVEGAWRIRGAAFEMIGWWGTRVSRAWCCRCSARFDPTPCPV